MDYESLRMDYESLRMDYESLRMGYGSACLGYGSAAIALLQVFSDIPLCRTGKKTSSADCIEPAEL